MKSCRISTVGDLYATNPKCEPGWYAVRELEEYVDPAYPSMKYYEKSHSESFLALAQNSFQPGGLYLLGEPEAALSPQRKLTLLATHAIVNTTAHFKGFGAYVC